MGTSAFAERRVGGPRRSFDATVELAPPDDQEAYEADAVDLSLGGMAVRTAYLPDVGSELDCRFALETGATVHSRGEVMWAKSDVAAAGEGSFGLRFTEMSANDARALREAMPATTPAASAPSRAPSAAPDEADLRARLHLPDMEAPLKARIRSEERGVLVLSSELSFLREGDDVAVAIGAAGARSTHGTLHQVAIEVDPQSRIARLLLTVRTPEAEAFEARHADNARAALEATPRAAAPALEAPPVVEATPAAKPARSERGAATEVLSAPPVDERATASTSSQRRYERIELEQLARPAARASSPGALRSGGDRDEHAMLDDADYDDVPEAERSGHDALRSEGPQAPSWMVAALGRVRAVAAVLGPKARALLAAFVGLFSAGLRGKLAASADKSAPAALSAPNAPRRPALRKQHPTASQPALESSGASSATTSVARAARKRVGLYALAGFGVVAIGVALASGGRESRARPPRPQVAVAGNAASAAPSAALPAPSAGAPGSSPTDTAALDPMSALDTVHSNNANNGAGARPMPTDLVAAARSRNADVSLAPAVRSVRSPGAGAPAPVAARAVTPTTAASNATSSRVVGNPAVRTGTTLRLRFDGSITTLSGGAVAGNAIVLRMPGRRSIDMAAPLVRQDPRLVNAAVYNRAAGAELTLRFRDAVPGFSARGAGNTLEVVLAAPAGRAAPAARAAHAR